MKMNSHIQTAILCCLLFTACQPQSATDVPSITDETKPLPTETLTELPTPLPTAEEIEDTAVPTPLPTAEEIEATAVPTPLPQGKTLTVTSNADSGPGSFRQALQDIQPYDTILFDPAVFPPDAPETILITSEPFRLGQDHITIDASNAGVILDASTYPRDTWDACLEVGSDGNAIMGLQFIFCTGAAIVINANNNIIGGDRGIGSGPTGQGNLISGNGVGIGIWADAENNIVTGNLVGTDLGGSNGSGNSGSGLWIVEGGSNNTIGPGNVIAYNQGCGIEVGGSESNSNTFSNNSIHSNQVAGICLGGGANAKIAAPFISEYHPDQGFIAGTTCPNCIVEVYSDLDDQGADYEGQIEADGAGVFVFVKGSAFTKENITTTSTDPDGNTSGFSSPVNPMGGIKTLQDGNNQPKFQLAPKTSKELPADHRLGWGLGGGGIWDDLKGNQWQWWLDIFNDFGNKRLDTSMQQGEEPIFWEREEFEVFPEYDLFIDRLNEYGIAVNYTIHFWDKEGHNNGLELETPRFKSEQQIQDFLQYVRFLTRHFKGRVQYYTIWSEPDNCGGTNIKCIEPIDYIELARRTIPVIHEEDPQAKIVTAPNVIFFDLDFLLTILRSDVASMFDVVSWHGIYQVTPSTDLYRNYYYEYPKILEEIKKTAQENGFTGNFWGTDISYCSEDYDCQPTEDVPRLRSDKEAAKYMARLFIIQMGLDVGVGWESISDPSQPWAYPTVRNLNTILANTTPTELVIEIENEPPNVASYAFRLPDGGSLLAIWSNGEVNSDEDQGLPADITIMDFSAQSVEGIDVLNGYAQELITDQQAGNLVINGLFILDYPILIRLYD